jgi:F0F1-type ATP synthase membrane subunit b/b'
MNRRNKLWARDRDRTGRDDPQEQTAVVQRSAATNGAPAESAAPITAAEGPPEAAETGPPDDLADFGAEVGSVLKSAQEAASRIRVQAREEASRIREKAKAEAAAELAEAKRLADADRAEAERVRAEAETDAEATRAEAETFGQELRSSAKREADALLEEARVLVARADAEIELRLHEAETGARQRRDELEAESQLYEQRLEKMLGIFHGMGSQLEQLLDVDRAEARQVTGKAEYDDRETLEEALQPEAAASERPAPSVGRR